MEDLGNQELDYVLAFNELDDNVDAVKAVRDLARGYDIHEIIVGFRIMDGRIAHDWRTIRIWAGLRRVERRVYYNVCNEVVETDRRYHTGRKMIDAVRQLIEAGILSTTINTRCHAT